MRRKDIVENPFKRFQQGVAKGFQSTQKGKGWLGPDSLERGIKSFFTDKGKDEKEKPTPKAGGKGTEKLKKTKSSPETSNDKLNPKKPIPKLATFTDGRIKYEYNPKLAQWIGSNGKRLSSRDGVNAYNKTDKTKREYVIENELKDKTMNNAIKEGLADLADMAERDHEVQMARADLYKIAKYAIKLHDMMKDITEADGLEGWQQAKITKAADYIGSVYHNLDYDLKFSEDVTEARDTHCSDKCCGSDVKREDCKCPPDCPHCNCNAVSEGKGKSNKQKAAIAIAKKDKYKESLANKLGNKLAETKAVCKDCGNPSYTTLPEEKQKGVDGKVCWKGYKRMGTKKKGGKTVDNCVKM